MLLLLEPGCGCRGRFGAAVTSVDFLLHGGSSLVAFGVRGRGAGLESLGPGLSNGYHDVPQPFTGLSCLQLSFISL